MLDCTVGRVISTVGVHSRGSRSEARAIPQTAAWKITPKRPQYAPKSRPRAAARGRSDGAILVHIAKYSRKIPKKSGNGGKISTKKTVMLQTFAARFTIRNFGACAPVFFLVFFYPFFTNFSAPFLIQNSPGRFQRTQILLENRTSPAHMTIPYISNAW